MYVYTLPSKGLEMPYIAQYWHFGSKILCLATLLKERETGTRTQWEKMHSKLEKRYICLGLIVLHIKKNTEKSNRARTQAQICSTHAHGKQYFQKTLGHKNTLTQTHKFITLRL